MKKVINITLGGIVFAIEQDAYDALAAYLEKVKANLGTVDDVAEVINDIESAIAEKFIARNRSEKLAVTVTEVEQVMREMGSPEEFNMSESADSPGGSEADASASADTEAKKRLYRDMDNALLGGVAAGLAQYFNIDTVIVRLLIVIAVFFNGLGVFVYLLLWLIVPAAKTTTDKYAMRGETVTLKEISDRVKRNIKGADIPDLSTGSAAWSNVRDILDRLFRLLSVVVRFLITLVRYIVGVAFIVAGAVGIAAVVSVCAIILLSDRVLFPDEAQLALDTLQGSTLGAVSVISIFAVSLVTALVLSMAGMSLMRKKNLFTLPKTVLLVVIWIVFAIVAASTTALQIYQIRDAYNPDEVVSDTPVHTINI